MLSKAGNLSMMNSWDDFFSYANSLTEKEKGDTFENLTKLILTTKPEYSSVLKDVWIQREGVPKHIREKINLPSTDEGIDLVAETFSGEYWAIQCKFKGQNQSPNVKELATFGNLANNYCKNISLTLLVHNGEKGVRKKKYLGENYSEIGLDFWLGLSSEDWGRVNQSAVGKLVRPEPRTPKHHQSEALQSATNHFLKNKASRGRMIMPCGTGKSLTAFWIASALESKSVIVVVPSLALIKQSLEDWTKEFIANREEPRPQWLVICSDESTSKLDKDEFVSDAHSLGIPTTTNVDVISAFLFENIPGRKVIFTTYQSSDKLAQASRNCDFSFDLAILDEAHKTVGVKSKTFATLLSDENITISRRVFMTATERVLRGNNDEVFSMDNALVYGDLFYQLTFKDAINATPPIISDYKVLTITVTNAEIQQLIARNKLITDAGNKVEEQESQSLASAIALRKATQTYGIKHAISFHRSIKTASDFTKLNQTLNDGNVDSVQLASTHISSKKSAGERARLLADFTDEKLALMTNARCLTEGVDVPAIDCVLFADPKQSTIDIVQATGRALRPLKGKEFGYIMLPLIVPDDVEWDEFTESTPFRQVARILSALSTQDERIADEFRITTAGKKNGGRRIIFDGSVPVGLNLDLNDFADEINSKIWERVAKVNWRPFEEARASIHELNLKNRDDWEDYCQSGKKPNDIPGYPEQTYFGKGWLGLGDWLGTGTVATRLREYLSFNNAREFVLKLKLKNVDDWKQYCQSGMKSGDIPANPNRTYAGKGWAGWGDWLGTGTVSPRLREYRSFEEARSFVHKLKLKNLDEWKEYCKSGKKPEDIPTKPDNTYSTNGWAGIGDWLGTFRIAFQKTEYRSFEEARAFVHELNLKKDDEWRAYCSSGKKPDDIPSNPGNTYKNKGWSGVGDWLGTGSIPNTRREFRPFDEARAFVNELKLKSGDEWREYCQSGNKPGDIPAKPGRTYIDEGWKGYGDWLGTNNNASFQREYRSFNDAREFVQALNYKSGKEWKEFSQSGKKPDDIPAYPNKTYAGKGWKNMGDWLGTGIIATYRRKYRSFEEARVFVHLLNLKNEDEWRVYCSSGKKPDDIPSNPGNTYIDKGWSGMGDWLGTGNIANTRREFRPFEEARAFVQELKLKSGTEWRDFYMSGKKPIDIPTNPKQTYAGNGWKDMGDWLGTGTVSTHLRTYRSFVEARAFVQELEIKSQGQWRSYCNSGRKPQDIPANPNSTYASQGWKGYGDWLGTNSISPRMREYRSFDEARVFVRALQLNNQQEWKNYCKSGKKPNDIPSHPNSIYINNGWNGLRDWLGKF